MKKVLVLLLCVAMVLSLPACKKEEKDGSETPTTTTTTTIETVPKAYAHNEVINRFFVNFVELHKGKYLDIASIRRAPATAGISTNGKELTEEELNKEKEKLTKVYLATINECAVTITDVSEKTYSSGVRYALQVEIVGGASDKDLDRMLEAFSAIALAADRDCTADSTDNASAMIKKMTKPFNTRTRVSDRVYIAYYTPVITDPVTQPCRISLLMMDDVVTNAATATTTAE